MCSPSGQGLTAFGAEQVGKGSKHFIRVEGKRKPPFVSANTSGLCIMKTFAFKSPPSVVLCVDVVSCTGARRSLLSLCPR